jgi:hypothetical protein
MRLRRIWTEQDDQLLAAAVAAGVSLQRICFRLKRREKSVSSRAKLLGIEVKRVQRVASEKRFEARQTPWTTRINVSRDG